MCSTTGGSTLYINLLLRVDWIVGGSRWENWEFGPAAFIIDYYSYKYRLMGAGNNFRKRS